jgi:hypothetical protein
VLVNSSDIGQSSTGAVRERIAELEASVDAKQASISMLEVNTPQHSLVAASFCRTGWEGGFPM